MKATILDTHGRRYVLSRARLTISEIRSLSFTRKIGACEGEQLGKGVYKTQYVENRV